MGELPLEAGGVKLTVACPRPAVAVTPVGAPGRPLTPVITAVGVDAADAVPTVFVTVTVARSVAPTSAADGRYHVWVAPRMGAQLDPALSHRLQTCAAVIGADPPHLPGSACRIPPTRAVPLTTGASSASGATGSVCDLHATRDGNGENVVSVLGCVPSGATVTRNLPPIV